LENIDGCINHEIDIIAWNNLDLSVWLNLYGCSRKEGETNERMTV